MGGNARLLAPFAGHLLMSALGMQGFESWIGWDTNPLYALLHEAIYCQGEASTWSAQRVREETEFAAVFDAEKATQEAYPVYFTGQVPYLHG